FPLLFLDEKMSCNNCGINGHIWPSPFYLICPNSEEPSYKHANFYCTRKCYIDHMYYNFGGVDIFHEECKYCCFQHGK
ncbi:MAG TPA: hypothetical protein PKD85_16510, partial [Saprospiraceae bacterium]|nr:hypothetical protein [Saprospiraceae bacterium]